MKYCFANAGFSELVDRVSDCVFLPNEVVSTT
jgi:hypothetical protein